jgi:hypothetical protein
VLQSLRAQRYPNLRVLLVPERNARDLAPIAARFADLAPTVLSPATGAPSSALWSALKAVRASDSELFGIVGDHDDLFPNHVRTVVRTLDGIDKRSWFGTFGLAYSAVAERTRDGFIEDRLSTAPKPSTPLWRRMRHFRFYHPGYLDDGAHEIHMGAFLARTAMLDDELLVDPELERGIDSYLRLLFAEKTLFAFSCEVTALTDDPQEDDETPQDGPVSEARRRIFFRTYSRRFPAASVYLHNVVFMTHFDRELMAPVVVASSFGDRESGRALAVAPVGSATRSGAVVHVEGGGASAARLESLRLSPGRHRLRCYFAAGEGEAGHDGPLLSVAVSGEDGERRRSQASQTAWRMLGDARIAEIELVVPREEGVRKLAVTITPVNGSGFDLLGVEIDRLARILTCSVHDLPKNQKVWLYGAGQGGKQAKQKLEILGVCVAGFVDKFKTGTLEGLPIVDVATAKRTLGAGTSLIIASMFWEEIRRDIEKAGLAADLYSFYPFTGDVLYALT